MTEHSASKAPSSPRPSVRNFSLRLQRAGSDSASAQSDTEGGGSLSSTIPSSVSDDVRDEGEEKEEPDLSSIATPSPAPTSPNPIAPPPRSSRRPSPAFASPALDAVPPPDIDSINAFISPSLSPDLEPGPESHRHTREESDSAPPLPQFLPRNSTSFKSFPPSTSLESTRSHASTLSFNQIVFKTELPTEPSDNPADYYSPVEGFFPHHQNHMTDYVPTPSSPEKWTPPSVPTLDSAFPPKPSPSTSAPPPASNPSTWRFPLFTSTPAAPTTPTLPSPSLLPISPKATIIDLPQSPPLPVSAPSPGYLSLPIDPTGPVPKRRASSGIYTPPTFPGPSGKTRSPSIAAMGSPEKRISIDRANAGRSSSGLGLGFAFSGLGLGYPTSSGNSPAPLSPQPPTPGTASSFLTRGRSWLGGSASSSPTTTSAATPSSPLPLSNSPASYFSSLLSPSLLSSSTTAPPSTTASTNPPLLSPSGTLSPTGVYTPASFYSQQLGNGAIRSRSTTGTSSSSPSNTNIGSPRIMTPLTPTSANLGRASSSSPALPSQPRRANNGSTSSPLTTPVQAPLVKRKPVPSAISSTESELASATSTPLPSTPTTSSANSPSKESTPSLITTSSSSGRSLSTVAAGLEGHPSRSADMSEADVHTRPDGGRDILGEMVGMGGGKTMVTLEVDAPVEVRGGRVW